MRRELSALSREYTAALQRHLKQGRRAGVGTAQVVGRRAVALGLETLDMVGIHEGALATLGSNGRRNRVIRRAELFFTEVVSPIEATHGTALKANGRLTRLKKTLARRAVSLKASNRLLKHGVAQRKAAEKALKKNRGHNAKLLKASRCLEAQLRRLAHQILSAQEDKRAKISRQLHNEIGQSLVSINVRLQALNTEAAADAKSLKTEIASTQRLVGKSVKTLNQFARQFGAHHES